ncbi:MAG: hypothetical protein ABR587_16810 [Candidatus Binatia bacterium]
MEVPIMAKPVRRRHHRSREEIAAILDKFDRSDLSVLAFAKREGLAVSTLRLWLSRRGRRPGRPRGPVLVPVHLVGPAAGDDVVFEVLLAGGRTLRFPRGVPAVELAAVCEALERPCSR